MYMYEGEKRKRVGKKPEITRRNREVGQGRWGETHRHNKRHKKLNTNPQSIIEKGSNRVIIRISTL